MIGGTAKCNGTMVAITTGITAEMFFFIQPYWSFKSTVLASRNFSKTKFKSHTIRVEIHSDSNASIAIKSNKFTVVNEAHL
jgi:hypothetical protein